MCFLTFFYTFVPDLKIWYGSEPTVSFTMYSFITVRILGHMYHCTCQKQQGSFPLRSTRRHHNGIQTGTCGGDLTSSHYKSRTGFPFPPLSFVSKHMQPACVFAVCCPCSDVCHASVKPGIM